MIARRAVIIPDCHIPYEDKKAYGLMLEVAKEINPDEIVILGDYADFYQVNFHGKSPDIDGFLIDEIDAVVARLRELRELFPLAKIVFLEGNHEYRLARYIAANCKEFFGILSVPQLLNLEAYKIHFVPYGPAQKYSVLGSKLIARHEPLGGGVHCAHQSVVKAGHSMIFGHTHRLQESQIVTINGENYRGISSGWLGDKDAPVMGYVKNHHQWALGFSVVTALDNGLWFNQLIHIIEGHALVDGELWKG